MRFHFLLSTTYLLLIAAHCDAIIELTEQYGVIESPGYPQTYSNDNDLSWRITTDPGYQIVIYFTEFKLEDSYDEEMGGACVYDYLQLENRATTKRFCGNEREFPSDAPRTLQEFRSHSNTMLIRFVSDYSNEGPLSFRFKAHYKVEDRNECAEMEDKRRTVFEDWDELIYCNHFCVNVPGSYYCTCRAGFELHENRHTCKASCENLLLTSDEGIIQSPDYPKPYSRLTDCDWTIQVRPGLSLNLQFNETFEIEDHFNYTECLYDWLKLSYNGMEETYCHGVPNNGSVIYTNVREARLEFHTDNAVELAGFKLTYTTIRQRCLESRDTPSNGKKNPNPKGYYEFEDTIEFKCDPGYNLVGESRITCQHDGNWTHAAPVCQIKECERPRFLEVPYSTKKFNGTYVFRNVITQKCNKWYKMISGTTKWKCSENATWQPFKSFRSKEIPVCKPECGKKNPGNKTFKRPNIFGGKYSAAHEWPWLVALNFGQRENVAASTCGGALISPDYILTAAHCITSKNRLYQPKGVRFPNHTHVWLGADNRQNDFFGSNDDLRYVAVEEVIRHPRFNEVSLDYDFALLRLSQSVIMDDAVRPICLPRTAQEFHLLVRGNSTGKVAGWGLYSTSDRPSYKLKHAELPTATSERCWSTFQMVAKLFSLEVPKSSSLTENMFCAGYSFGSSASTCRGDSGGPYMVKDDESPKYFALGLVSWGLDTGSCGTSISYSVFAHINQNIATWIRSVIDRPK